MRPTATGWLATVGRMTRLPGDGSVAAEYRHVSKVITHADDLPLSGGT